MTPTHYIDDIHRDSVFVLLWLRKLFLEAHLRVAEWEPRPLEDTL